MDPRDEALLKLGRRQHDMLGLDQIAAVGMSYDAVKHRVARKRLFRVRRGVLSLRPPPYSYVAMAMAVALAYGDEATISFRAGGRIWKLPVAKGPFEVTTPTQRRARPGVIAHRAAELPSTRRDGVPVTTIVRTLEDLALVTRDREFEKAVAEALHLGLVRDSQLLASDSARLRELFATPPAFTRGEAEERLLALVRAADLPPPQTNAYVSGLEFDAVWLGPRVVAEFNSYAFHSTRPKFDRDQERLAILADAGFVLVPVTWDHLTKRPELLVARLARALARRPQ